MVSSYLAIGAVAGMMSGLLGIGGGIIVVPALSAIFTNRTDIPADIIMQMSIGTSLAIMIITLISSAYAHHLRGAVKWHLAKQILPGLAIGAIIGVLIASKVSSFFLSVFFSIFLLVIGLMLIFKRKESTRESVFKRPVMLSISGVIGILSSILGAGGGTMLVPFFLHCKLDIREATGTSVVCGMMIASIATLGFIVSGLYSLPSLPWCTGYIYWPAFLGIAATSVLFAPIGAALAHRLPKTLLKRIFGIFLLLMAADMLFIKQ